MTRRWQGGEIALAFGHKTENLAGGGGLCWCPEKESEVATDSEG
jgi:hypothetical protein